jgi:hypothetical protein
MNEFNTLPNDYSGRSLVRPIPVRAKLAALVDRYVDGTPRSRLARPYGEGSEPIWRRMRPPRQAVVQFRTWDTRTFGFFSVPNVFVACTVVLADVVKAQNLYERYADDTHAFMKRVSANAIDGETDVDRLVTD